LLILIK